MLLRVVLASLRRRSRQLVLIATAVLVAAATVATLAGFSARTHERLGSSLAAFGPNLTVRPQVGGPETITRAMAARIQEIAGAQAILVSETSPPVPLSPLPPTPRRERGDVAAAISPISPIPPGSQDESSAAFPLSPRERGPGGEVSGVRRLDLRTDPARLDEVAREIESRVEGVEARPLLKVSASDARLTRRLTLVLVAVSAVSLLLALISVGAATTALLGERRTEVGLLLALGYTGRRVGGFLAAELLAAAVIAGLLGQLLGDLAASALADRLLGGGGGVLITWSGFAASATVAALVVGSSLALALHRIQKLDAARVLRGD